MIEVSELNDHIFQIALRRPEQLNALTDTMMGQLRSAFIGIENNPRCKVLILTGHGRAFCAGLDLKANIEAHSLEREDANAAIRLQQLYAGAIPMLRRLRQPVIAAINGAAVGAGMGLALAADIRIAGQSASFHVGAVKMALSAGECGISYHLPRLLGAGRAFEMMLTGRAIHAEEAFRIGLVTELVEDEDLRAAAVRTAESIISNATFSVEQTKRVMWTNLHAAGLEAALELENHTQTLAMLRPDFAEAIDAFVAKRKPVFSESSGNRAEQ
jgi:enoyl-CoA hydratase